jgi:gluconokinase
MGAPRPSVILVTGISGSGKTTVGKKLAARLGWDYAEADEFHPKSNIEKMKAGIPLTDEDRMPWLRAIAEWIEQRLAEGRPAVVSSSALKRRYRDMLRRPGVRSVFLDGGYETIARRIKARKGHFFPAELLNSQFRELEPPGPDEESVRISVEETADDAVQQIIDALFEDGEDGRNSTDGKSTDRNSTDRNSTDRDATGGNAADHSDDAGEREGGPGHAREGTGDRAGKDRPAKGDGGGDGTRRS